MKDKTFIDTNIFVYLFSTEENKKRDICIDELDKYLRITSTQIFNETSNVWFKKYNLDANTIKKYLDNIERICDEVLCIDRKTINYALDLKARYGYSYYDCLMLASALESSCDILLTEDMSDGQVIENKLKIVNPFKNGENL